MTTTPHADAVLARVVDLRAELQSLAKELPAVARACAERVGFSGEVMLPLREHVAAGQLSGDLSSDHAVVIARVLDRLPVHVPVDELAAVEAAMVEYARKFDPSDTAGLGRRVLDFYDPDGPKPRDEAQRRRRSLRLWQRDNGMGAIKGDLPVESPRPRVLVPRLPKAPGMVPTASRRGMAARRRPNRDRQPHAPVRATPSCVRGLGVVGDHDRRRPVVDAARPPRSGAEARPEHGAPPTRVDPCGLTRAVVRLTARARARGAAATNRLRAVGWRTRPRR